MSSKPTNKPNRIGVRISDSEKSSILSHAATFGVTAAAEEFGLSRKSIQRYKRELDSGRNKELSRLVAKEAANATARSRSKIQRALDALLDRVISLAPEAKLSDAISGVEKIGDLATTRKVLGVEGDSEGEAAAGPQGVGRAAEGSPEETQQVH